FVYAGVGVVGGALSALFIWLIERLKKRIHRLDSWRYYVLPPLAGFLTGVVGLWFPEIMGAGYDSLNSALHGQFTWQLLLFIGLAKLLVTLIAFAAETPGGMFAPALFIGGMLGGALGGVAHRWWPYGSANAEAYMLVGMGTFFAGVFRAPITSIFMVFEASASYMIILPVMIANTTAYLISRKLHPTPFFKMLAELEGVNLPSAEEKRNFQMLRVEDAMRPLSAPEPPRPGLRVYPDEPLDAALRILASQPRIQVVSRLRPDEVLGILTLEDVHHAYHIMETQGVQTGTANDPAG
ncbi:MAG: chloride channel protein, partial [Bryobacteraceae bacterium]